MKLFCTAILGLVLLAGAYTPASAQYDNRTWPVFPFDPELDYAENPPPVRKAVGMLKYIPQPYPAEALKQKPARTRIMQSSGVELVNASPYSLDQTETWIAINPTNPNNIIGGSNDSRYNSFGRYRMVAYVSTDGGRSWLDVQLPAVPSDLIDDQSSSATNFDPGICFDSKGRAFYVFGKTQTIGGDLEGDNGVFVSISEDGGLTWSDGEPVTLNFTVDNIFDDKFLIAADFTEGSPYQDRVYVAWTRFQGVGANRSSDIHFAYMDDASSVWSAPTPIPGGGAGSVQSPIPAVGPNGEVYVAWRRGSGTDTRAIVQMSTDGGASWALGAGVEAQTVKTSGTLHSESNRFTLADKRGMRISSYPGIAVDVAPSSPYKGRVYVVQSGRADVSSNIPHVFLSYSDNKGNSWSNRIIVDNNETTFDVFLPNITVDPVSGAVAVVYYSSQDDETNTNTGVNAYVAISRDGGQNWKHIRLTEQTWFIDGANDVSNQGTGNIYWGDYTSISSYNNKIMPLFWMPNGPQGDYRSLDAWTALLSTKPQSPVNVEAKSTSPNPVSVTITWQDPTQNLLGENLGDFDIEILRKDVLGSDEITLGTVGKGVESYTDNSATDGREYEYCLITVTPDDQRSILACARAWAGGALKPNPPTAVYGIPNQNGVELYWMNPATHVDETEFHDFSSINIYKDDALVGSIDDSAILRIGQEVSFTIGTDILPANEFHSVRLTAVGTRGAIETESELSGVAFIYSGAARAANTFSDNFDGSERLPLYTDGTWALTTEAANSAPNCITDSPGGKYGKSEDNDLIFAPVTVESGFTTLEFYHIALIDDLPGDWGQIYVSTDYGQSWEFFTLYDRSTYEDEGVWGNTVGESEWVRERRSLAKYEGKTILLRFVLNSNQIREDDGWYIDDITLNNEAVSVNDEREHNTLFRLGEIYPNPATALAHVMYSLDAAADVQLEIYNALGHRVAVLDAGYRTPGAHSMEIDASQFAGGVYFCRLAVNGHTAVRKLTVIR